MKSFVFRVATTSLKAVGCGEHGIFSCSVFASFPTVLTLPTADDLEQSAWPLLRPFIVTCAAREERGVGRLVAGLGRAVLAPPGWRYAASAPSCSVEPAAFSRCAGKALVWSALRADSDGPLDDLGWRIHRAEGPRRELRGFPSDVLRYGGSAENLENFECAWLEATETHVNSAKRGSLSLTTAG